MTPELKTELEQTLQLKDFKRKLQGKGSIDTLC